MDSSAVSAREYVPQTRIQKWYRTYARREYRSKDIKQRRLSRMHQVLRFISSALEVKHQVVVRLQLESAAQEADNRCHEGKARLW